MKSFAIAALFLMSLGACTNSGAATANETAPTGLVAVTIRSGNGAHLFKVETARTEPEQQRGLMFRTDIPKDGGMLFHPYPVSGPPQEASFWMHNTPSPLDIVFIRADGTIARIAEETTPFSDLPISSGEPVAAVLEILGGRAAQLGIAAGDKVSWAGGPGQ